ncbi:HAD hydrolase-like protein [Cohnella faecalis]|uniref:HAD family hydrolase n=1 Tax=Cohnella faecalis TaxID=2315694 RepID=A0A398CV16_9BACL|nr:HAD hydrolase-like protein [Cohnella faecalis]RIE03717.1 HAD family hydrolase [Cohnella faecalis]
MIKHVVFDFDGTIVDSLGAVVDIYNEIAGQYRFTKLDQDRYRALMNVPLRERIKALGVPMHRIFFIRNVARQFKQKYQTQLHLIRMIDGVLEAAERLKEQGYVLSILTSNSEANVREYLRNREISIFDHVYSANGLFGKHRTINQYRKQHRLSREELIYVGDETRDIQACRKSRVPIIAVTWGVEDRALLAAANPDYLIDRPQEIANVLFSETGEEI